MECDQFNMPRLKTKNTHQVRDRILPLAEAALVLKAELGMSGWSRTAIQKKIAEGWQFRWVEGLHYFCSTKGLSSLNVDAICRELIR